MARFQLTQRSGRCCVLLLGVLTLLGVLLTARHRAAQAQHPDSGDVDLLKQTAEEALAKSAGCVVCHQSAHDPHYKESLHLGCCDCHGGDATAAAKEAAHVAPRFPEVWISSANPVRSY